MIMKENDRLQISKVTDDKIVLAMEENFLAYISAIPSKNNEILFNTADLLLLGTGIIGRLRLPYHEEKVRELIDIIKTNFTRPLLWCIGPSSLPGNLGILLQEIGYNVVNAEPGMFLDLREFKQIFGSCCYFSRGWFCGFNNWCSIFSKYKLMIII